MTIGMLVAGIGCLLGGLLAIGFGIPINEFGLGNTLILSGSVAACSGLVILSLWVAVRELKTIARQLELSPKVDAKRNGSQPAALPRPSSAESDMDALYADSIGGGELSETSLSFPPSASPHAPWVEEPPLRDRPRQETLPAPGPEAQPKSRRNLMFSSTSRRERERSPTRGGDVPTVESRAAAADVNELPPVSFDEASARLERMRPAEAPSQRRAPRGPSPSGDQAAGRQAPMVESPPVVTVLKSGVVDGMAYSLYSDGSIEAQMPEGMMRFASIDELRAHLDQRP
jgi:hypothetical protein